MDICRIQIPESFVKLLDVFKDVFTAPSFRYFKVIISGIILNEGKQAITAIVKLCGLESNFSNLHRFLSWYRWDINSLAFILLSLLIRGLGLIGCPLVFALDDTLVGKYGPKIFGRGAHFDHSAKGNKPKYIMGHNWVVIGLLYYWARFRKWLCFPFMAKLFIPEKHTPNDQPYRSRIEIAVEMLALIKAHLNVSFILVADALYAKKKLLKASRDIDIIVISRLRHDAALYKEPKKSSSKKRGRPKIYGERLPSLTDMAKDPYGYKDQKLLLYGKLQSVKFKAIEALWKPLGGKIKVLIVHYPKSKGPSFFFCTDCTMDSKKIIELVAARWGIETSFLNLKEFLGLKDWQQRVQKGVKRSAMLTCTALSLLMLWSLQKASQIQPELWDKLPWYGHKSTVSIIDMRKQFKNHCIQKNIFSILQGEMISRLKIDHICGFLKQVV